MSSEIDTDVAGGYLIGRALGLASACLSARNDRSSCPPAREQESCASRRLKKLMDPDPRRCSEDVSFRHSGRGAGAVRYPGTVCLTCLLGPAIPPVRRIVIGNDSTAAHTASFSVGLARAGGARLRRLGCRSLLQGSKGEGRLLATRAGRRSIPVAREAAI